MKMKFGVLAGAIVAVMMGVSGQAMAGSDEEQLARMADPDQWPAPGRDFALTRHSTLADISTKNIGKLQMVWLQGTNALRGHEGFLPRRERHRVCRAEGGRVGHREVQVVDEAGHPT